MAKFSDREIIEAIREGRDEKVVASLYQAVLPGIVKYICANQGTKDDAFDLFQDALLIFLKMVISNGFDDEKYRIHPYIYTITKNLWTNKMIKKGRGLRYEKTKLEEQEDQLVIGAIISEERKLLLQSVFNTLGSKCIEALSLFYYQNLTMKEIAVKMNFSNPDVAKLKVYRCRKELSEKIKSNNYLREQFKN